jgi:hypothetical protein
MKNARSHATLPVDMPLGAHLVTSRSGYTHHGIHVGGGKVVHYAGLCRSLNRGPVEEVPLAAFACGRPVAVKRDLAAHFPAEVVVARARSRLGENRYRIATNNCEHFCVWCLCGESRSEQIERLLARPRAIARAVTLIFTQLALHRSFS